MSNFSFDGFLAKLKDLGGERETGEARDLTALIKYYSDQIEAAKMARDVARSANDQDHAISLNIDIQGMVRKKIACIRRRREVRVGYYKDEGGL